jgi:hypothetical protein
MREAASALALDPALGGAAELVARLMLEPPRETPPEVKDAMAQDDVRDAREVAKAGMWAVIGALMFIPLLWWIAPRGTPYVPMLMAFLVLQGVVSIHATLSKTPRPGLIIVANTVIIIVLARMYSPIMIAPGIAASLAMAMVLTPRFSFLGSPISIAILMAGGIAGPLLLEQMGVISRTMSVSEAGVLFSPPALSGQLEGPTILVGALFAVALVAGAAIAGYQMRARALDAARHLHMQTWQLRQLVPR